LVNNASKFRPRSESFFDHFSQAALFWDSQSEPEKEPSFRFFQFELGTLETEAVSPHP
jgi:catalase